MKKEHIVFKHLETREVIRGNVSNLHVDGGISTFMNVFAKCVLWNKVEMVT